MHLQPRQDPRDHSKVDIRKEAVLVDVAYATVVKLEAQAFAEFAQAARFRAKRYADLLIDIDGVSAEVSLGELKAFVRELQIKRKILI